MRIAIHAEDLPAAQPVSELVLEAPATVGDAARLLTLRNSTGLMILVNGKIAQWNTLLNDGDVIELIPALGGG